MRDFLLGIIGGLGFGNLIGMAISERLNKHHNERIERIQKRAEEDQWRSHVNAEIRAIKDVLGIR